MKIEYFKRSQLSTSKWSGGSTTQLYIYPPGADYVKRDFLFRLSTATIELAESAFTPLPGYERKLMLLNGELELIHNNIPGKSLQKFNVAEFSGEWQTTSKGVATDFNLIYKKPAEGELQGFQLKPGEIKDLLLLKQSKFIAFYFASGSGEINLSGSFIKFTENDLVCFHGKPGKEIRIIAEAATSVAFVELTF